MSDNTSNAGSFGTDPNFDRLMQLLSDRAVAPLSVEEERELESLLANAAATPQGARALSAGSELERAASVTAAALTSAAKPSPMPTAARARMLRAGEAIVSARIESKPNNQTNSQPGKPSRSFAQWGGWAAAAVLAIAASALFFRTPPKPAPAPTNVAMVAELKAKAGTLITPFTATGDANAPTLQGEVVWNQSEQRGFLRLKGVTNNDPAKEQYQIWIFDGGRDADFPVDGGVFDVASQEVDPQGELVVPIRAKLEVRQPAAFAFTVERPGGVVVTKRDRVVGLAKVGG